MLQEPSNDVVHKNKNSRHFPSDTCRSRPGTDMSVKATRSFLLRARLAHLRRRLLRSRHGEAGIVYQTRVSGGSRKTRGQGNQAGFCPVRPPAQKLEPRGCCSCPGQGTSRARVPDPMLRPSLDSEVVWSTSQTGLERRGMGANSPVAERFQSAASSRRPREEG